MRTDGRSLWLDLLDDGQQPWQTQGYLLDEVDSLTLSATMSDEEKGHDKYRVFTMHITTLDEAPVADRENWVDCHVSIDGMGQYSPYSGTAKIKGRGNSTWEWYDKKPYKIKLDEKSKLLGLEKAKDWNLLANYRDLTDLMNAYAFELARGMGMPYTNHTRFVELFLNGDYIGLYQLTEKIEVDKNRVNISEEGGLLLSLDLDDGPSLSPDAGDNFWSRIYGLPVCVKYPKEPSAERLDSIRSDLSILEKAIQQHNYPLVDSLMDIPSFISLLQLHEYLYNVELQAPRSVYLFKDKDGKYTWGPMWDWDAGFDFDWTNMYTGHDYFGSVYKLILGQDPAHTSAASGFWSDMFNDADFVSRYKEQWQGVSDSLAVKAWDEMEHYLINLKNGPYARDITRWPIPAKTPEQEVERLHDWLLRRLEVVNDVVKAYPAGVPYQPSEDGEATLEVVNGEICITQPVDFRRGYTQSGMIEIPSELVYQLLGVQPNVLVPINANGTQGTNTAAGRYGAWFDAQGNTNDWGRGHVFIESDDLYAWHFGCHPDNCRAGDTHTVRMQYSRSRKTLIVNVKFVVK